MRSSPGREDGLGSRYFVFYFLLTTPVSSLITERPVHPLLHIKRTDVVLSQLVLLEKISDVYEVLHLRP